VSIKALARELYRARQKVDRLEKELAQAGLQDRDRIRQELQAAEAEKNQLRKMLDGAKVPSPFANKTPGRHRR
jgi:uncharacterized protein (DUF3084 family)